MDITIEAKLLTAESKPYKVDGNEGVSHKIRLNIAGEIYVCKSSESQVRSLSAQAGKGGMATIAINSRKENMSLELLGFTPEKAGK